MESTINTVYPPESKRNFIFLQASTTIVLLLVWAYIVVTSNNMSSIGGLFAKPLREFLFFIPLIFTPFLIPGSFIRKILVFVLLVIPCIFGANYYGHYPELEGIMLILYAGISLVMFLVGYAVVAGFKKINSRTLEFVFFGVVLLIMGVLYVAAAQDVLKNINLSNNNANYNRLVCKAAYGITPEELKGYCEKFIPVDSHWERTITECTDAYAHLQQDKNYIDNKLISPRNYTECRMPGAMGEGVGTPQFTDLVRPEYKDPSLCDRVKTIDPEYFKHPNANTDCYYGLAMHFLDPQYCAKTTVNKDRCYEDIAFKKKDATICAAIEYPMSRYVCEAVLKNDKNICRNLSSGPKASGPEDVCRMNVDRGCTNLNSCVKRN